MPRVYLAPCLKSKQPNKEIFLNRVCFFSSLEFYTKSSSFGPGCVVGPNTKSARSIQSPPWDIGHNRTAIRGISIHRLAIPAIHYYRNMTHKYINLLTNPQTQSQLCVLMLCFFFHRAIVMRHESCLQRGIELRQWPAKSQI